MSYRVVLELVERAVVGVLGVTAFTTFMVVVFVVTAVGVTFTTCMRVLAALGFG